MSYVGEKLKLVPAAAWIVGVLLSVLLVLPVALGPMVFDSEMRGWPLIAKIGLLAVAPAFIILYSGLVGFIYADAKRRRMRHVLWAWLALVPYFIGVILYFILRDPLPSRCSNCHTDVPRVFAYCPGCGASIHPICGACGKALQSGWTHCPHCGSAIKPHRPEAPATA